MSLKRMLLIPLAGLALAGCAQSGTPAAGPTESTTPAAATQSGPSACAYNVSGKAARPVDPPPTDKVPTTGTVAVTLRLTQGPITLTLDREHAPCTVNSFLSLLNQDYYTDTVCHRLTTSGIFVLQCGDPTGTGSGGPGYSFADEVYTTDTYPAGTVAMANAGPNTNGSQFFLVYQDTELKPNYTVFGHLDPASLKVITGIAANGSDSSYREGDGKPNQEVRIEGYSMG